MSFVVAFPVLIRAGRPTRFLRAIACVFGLALSAPAVAQVTWDADTGTSGPQDGSGTWSTVDANWWNGSTDVVWPNLSTSTATIGANSGAAGTITVDGSLTLNAITFNAPGSGSYTVTGGTLGFAGTSPTITANTAATIGSDITSGVGLTKNGTGTLTLSGSISNTTGGVSFSQGEVTLTGTLTNTSTSTLAVGSSNGGTLTIAGGSMSTTGAGARSVVIAGGAGRSGTIAVTGGTLSPVGMLISEDSGGNGVFTQSGGTTTIGGSNLWLTGTSSTLTVTGGTLSTPAMYTVFGNTNSASTVSVSGSGSLTVNGRVQVGTSGRNGIDLTVNVGDGTAGGTLQVNSFSWGGATGTAVINFNGGTFVGNATHSLPTQISTVVKSGGANINVSTSQTLTMSSPLSDGSGGGGLVKLGTGTLALTGANTFTGATRISAGSLSLGNALALQNSTLDLDAADAGTISAINQNSTLGGLTGSRNLDMLTRTLSIGNNDASTTYSGSLSNGALTKIGAGTLTLTGENVYTGTTTIDSGTLQIGAGGTAGGLANASTITGSAGASLVFSRTDDYGGDVSNDIGGGLGLTLNSGTLTLTGTNAYAGTTSINGGVLGLGAAGALGGAGDIVFGGGTLQFSASNVGDYAARVKNSGSAIAVDTNGQNVTFAGSLDSSNTGGLVKSGAGTLTLSGSNSYTGGTTLTGGGFVIGNANGWGSGDVTYNVDANTTTAFSLPESGTIANNITINKPGANRRYTFQQNQSNNVTLSGDITLASGNGPTFSLSGVSAGTFTLTGSNSFGADVFTAAGVTVRIGGTNAAGGAVWRPNLTGNMVLLDGADFKSIIGNAVASYSMETAGTATVSGTVFNRDNANVEVNLPADAELQFTGALRAEGGFTTGTYTKTGAGTWVVGNGGNSAFTFNVNEGVLQVPTFTALGGQTDASWLVLDGGTLRHSGAASSTTKAFTLGASGGSLDASGTGTAAFTSGSAVAFTGSGNRTLTLTGTNTGSNALGLALNDNGADVVSLVKTGAGTWVLSGSTNTYTGDTTIAGGTLKLGSGGSFANSPRIIVGDAAGSPGATLDLSDKDLFAIGSAQTLMGKGRVALGQNTALTINGLFSPGNSPGLFTYDGGSTTLSGTTLMEIWGTARAADPGYDAVDVINSGLLTLGGILELDFDQNFADSTSFTLFDTLTSGSLAGGFASITITGVNNDYVGLSFTQDGNVWTTGFNGNNQGLRLTQTASEVTLDVIVVPEPGTAVFAGIGIAIAGWLLRNRRRAAR